MEYVQPEPQEIPIECDCFGEPFSVGKKVLVVDEESKASRHAGALALGMIMGVTELYQLHDYRSTGIRLPKPQKEHTPHSGAKERQRRLKKLAARKDT